MDRKVLSVFVTLLLMACLATARSHATDNTTYTYDSLGRLIQVVYADGTGVTYSYDAAGNRTSVVSGSAAAPKTAATSAIVAKNSSENILTPKLSGWPAGSVSVYSSPGKGKATVSGLSFKYTPDTDYTGNDTFQFKATNGAGTSSDSTFTVTVLAPPTVGTVTPSVNENSLNNTVSLSLGGGTASSVAVSTQATHGTARASGTSITYTPTFGYYGSDSFQYTATNISGTSSAATATVTVVPLPVVVGPIYASVAKNSGLNNIAPQITDGPAASLTIHSNASPGTAGVSSLMLTYTTYTGDTGPDSFEYKATKAGVTSSPATVTVAVYDVLTGSVSYSSHPCGNWGPPDYNIEPDLHIMGQDWWFWPGDETLHDTPPGEWQCNETVTDYESVPWVAIDLGSTKTIYQVAFVIDSYDANNRVIEYSTNGSSWTARSGGVTEGDYLGFNNVSARYIRVRDSSDWLSVEFDVRGW